MVKPAVPRLQLVTDETLQERLSHLEIARLAVEGALDAVQLREKRAWTTRELMDVGRAMLDACAGSSTVLVVDDRADVARSIGAPAVHLGANDLDIPTARAILGSDVLIGGTANSYEEAQRVGRSGVDYLGVGPIYGTTSKANPAPVMGLETLARICRDAPVPVVAIGSITPERIPEVMACGAHGVAVLSAVLRADDPLAAAVACREAVEQAAARRAR